MVNSIKFATKLPKTIYAKLKAKFSKEDSANLKVESQQCNETVDQTKTEEVLSENPADLSDPNVDESLNLENNNSAAKSSCTSEEVLSENPANLSNSNLDENLNLENNSSVAENSCTSEEVLSENPADLNVSNSENSINAVADNKNSCKQLFKNVVKYRIHEILLAVTTVVLYKYCQQSI